MSIKKSCNNLKNQCPEFFYEADLNESIAENIRNFNGITTEENPTGDKTTKNYDDISSGNYCEVGILAIENEDELSDGTYRKTFKKFSLNFNKLIDCLINLYLDLIDYY